MIAMLHWSGTRNGVSCELGGDGADVRRFCLGPAFRPRISRFDRTIKIRNREMCTMRVAGSAVLFVFVGVTASALAQQYVISTYARNVFIAENNRVRKIAPDGTITTI